MKTAPLRAVADVWSSNVDKHAVKGEMPVQLCNYTDVYYGDTVAPHPNLMWATASASQIARNKLLIGDTVLTKDSEDPGDIGISATVTSEADDFVCGYHLAIARPLSGSYPRYLTWALRSRPVLDYFSTAARGISRYGLGLADLRATPIPLHTPEDQRRIADFLDDRVARIDQIIAARKTQVASVKQDRAAYLQGEFTAAAVGRGTARLGYLLSNLEQGWSPQADATPAEGGRWGVMRAGSVNGGFFRAGDNKALPEGLKPRTEYEIHGGDILMSRASGSPELIGSVAVVPQDVRPKLLLPDKLYRLTLLPGWSADFVVGMLRAHENRERIRLGISGAEGMANNLPSGVIRGLRVPQLSLRAQGEVVGRLAARQQADRNFEAGTTRSIELLTEYKQSLITAAVTGEFDVTTASTRIPGEQA